MDPFRVCLPRLGCHARSRMPNLVDPTGAPAFARHQPWQFAPHRLGDTSIQPPKSVLVKFQSSSPSNSSIDRMWSDNPTLTAGFVLSVEWTRQ